MTNAIISARVSTREQAEEGYSLQAQLKLAIDYAERQGFNVVDRYIFSESASGKQYRKEFNKMMDAVKKTKTPVLICEKVDRITRHPKDSLMLNDWLDEDETRQLHFVKQGLILHKYAKSNEIFNWDMQVAQARFISNNISEEVLKGFDQKAYEGWSPASRKRGYKTTGETGKKTWAIDTSEQSEAPYIKQAFKLYNTGHYTVVSLSRHLATLGYKPNGKAIPKNSLHSVLTDCFYCGEFMWKGKHYPNGKHEPLISKNLFHSVQDRLGRKVAGKYRKHNFLLKGMCTCAECGRSIVGERQKGNHYYKCTRYNTPCTQRKCTREEVLEEQIGKLMAELQCNDKRLLKWVSKALRATNKPQANQRKQQVKKLQAQELVIDNRMSEAYDDKVDGKITEEFYVKKHNEYSKELTQIRVDIEKLKNKKQSKQYSYSHIFELAQTGAERYLNSTNVEVKREALQTVFSNLQIKEGIVVPQYVKGMEAIAKYGKNNDWLGRRDSNPRMSVPETDALPLGDAPMM